MCSFLDLSPALLSQMLAIVSISFIDLSANFGNKRIASKTKQSLIILLVKLYNYFYFYNYS